MSKSNYAGGFTWFRDYETKMPPGQLIKHQNEKDFSGNSEKDILK